MDLLKVPPHSVQAVGQGRVYRTVLSFDSCYMQHAQPEPS
eukprot:COSAG01_NODE_4955_length_4591_cov_6.138468_9_plen_40_part_00